MTPSEKNEKALVALNETLAFTKECLDKGVFRDAGVIVRLRIEKAIAALSQPTTGEEVDCRKVFEQWSESMSPGWGDKLFVRKGEDYAVLQTHCDWKVWQAAWNAKPVTPVGGVVVTVTDGRWISDELYEKLCNYFEGRHPHNWACDLLSELATIPKCRSPF